MIVDHGWIVIDGNLKATNQPRVNAVLAALFAAATTGCEDDCAHGGSCPPDHACVYDHDTTDSDAICVVTCDYDSDCPTGQTCTGRGSGPGPLQLIIRFCKAPSP